MSGTCQLPMDSRRDEAQLPLQQHPELLMAAREGNPTQLTHLLGNGRAAQPGPEGSGVVVNLGDADTAMDESARPTDAVGVDVAMDVELNKILHVIASNGDSPDFLECARVVYGMANHLLDACNANGDTPFHCAARAGMVEMVSELISLARTEGGDHRVKAVLGKQNKQGETALHEALRLADKQTVKLMVSRLVVAHAELARVPPADGTSAMYLAILLGHDDIAQGLHEYDEGLSYSGPKGQNVLHAAVLRSAWMTTYLLQWNKKLSKQGDNTKGRTPLHFAAIRGLQVTVMLLINADKSLVYQSDNDGSFPIHTAVTAMQGGVVLDLLKKCPDCAQLRDARGRTVFHIMAQQGSTVQVLRVLQLLRENQRLASIINMQDNDGNTGLHHAVLAGSLHTFLFIFCDKNVMLNLSNCEGRTALDLAWSNIPTGVTFGLDPRNIIPTLLVVAGARYGAHSGNHDPIVLDEEKEAKKIMDSTPTIGIVSALLVTVTFAASFTVPGGYRADDDPESIHHTTGTPVLAATYSFQAFIVANDLALICSSMATISLMYAGITTVGIRTRMCAFSLSICFLNSSARSLAAAFAFGMYATLSPAAHAAAVVTWLCMAVSLLDVAWFVCELLISQLTLLSRIPARKLMPWLAVTFVCPLLGALWPYVIIAGFLVYSKIFHTIN